MSPDVWLDALARASLQGALLAMAVWAGLRLFRHGGPELRSWIWVLVLAKFALSLFFVWKLAVLPPPPEVQVVPSSALMLDLPALPAKPEGPNTLLWLWLAGACSVAVWAGMGHLRLLRTLRASTPASIRVRWIALQLSRSGTDVRTHPNIPVPMISGVFRPVIYVPGSFETDLDEAEVRMVLAHEIAHIERKDTLARMFVLGCQSLFFFHPSVWIARREWQVASESACDRRAIEVTQTTPHAYAAMLLKISVGARRAPALALSVVPADKTLRRRIENMKITTQKTMLSRFGAFAAILTISVLAMPFAFAQRAPDGHQTKAKQKPQESLDSARMKIEILVKSGQLSGAEGQAKLKELDERFAANPAGHEKLPARKLTKAQSLLPKARGDAKILELKGVPLVDKAKLDELRIRLRGTRAKDDELAGADRSLAKARLEHAKALEIAGMTLPDRAKSDELRIRLQETLAKDKLVKVEGLRSKVQDEAMRALEISGMSKADRAKLEETRVRIQGLFKGDRLREIEGVSKVYGERAKALTDIDRRHVEGLLSKSRLPNGRLPSAPIDAKEYKARLEAMGKVYQGLAPDPGKIKVGDPLRLRSNDLALPPAKFEAKLKEMTYKEIRDRLAAATAEIRKAVEEGRMSPEEGKTLMEEFKRALGGG